MSTEKDSSMNIFNRIMGKSAVANSLDKTQLVKVFIKQISCFSKLYAIEIIKREPTRKEKYG